MRSPSSRSRGFLACLLLTLTAVATSCGGDTTVPRGVAGYYVLQTVNDLPVPMTVVDEGGYKLEVLEGSFTIDATGTYSSSGTYRETADGETVTFTAFTGGTWTRSGSTITFSEAGTTLEGTLASGVLTIDQAGIVAVFQRDD